jgi:RNA polymerase sigma factor (sigma-70 family)
MTEKDYNECVKLYADNVYRFILKNLKNEEDAKDVVQSSFEKMWINKEGVEYSKCKRFLFTVAYNTMIDHIRKNKRIVLKVILEKQHLVAITNNKTPKGFYKKL